MTARDKSGSGEPVTNKLGSRAPGSGTLGPGKPGGLVARPGYEVGYGKPPEDTRRWSLRKIPWNVPTLHITLTPLTPPWRGIEPFCAKTSSPLEIDGKAPRLNARPREGMAAFHRSRPGGRWLD